MAENTPYNCDWTAATTREAMMLRTLSIVLAAALLVSACGTVQSDRAASGGGIGAAGGAIVGALTGGLSVLAGALIGATAGALTGAVTSEDEINLGEPIWKRWFGRGQTTQQSTTQQGAVEKPGAPVHLAAMATGVESDRAMVQGIQTGLKSLGYDPGIMDGRLGPRTRLAIGRYQTDQKLLVDRRASSELLLHIEVRVGQG